MPTYVYRCQNCDTLTEAFQKITENPLTTCEDCGGSLRRVLQPVGIVFKGSGFYVTDYKRTESSGSNGKSAETAGSKSEAGSGKSEAGGGKSEGGETKPAAEKAAKKETAQPAAAP